MTSTTRGRGPGRARDPGGRHVIASVGENLVVSARDVTERRRNEEELRLRAELLDLAHDAVIVRDPAESRVTFWNREAQAIYGYSRSRSAWTSHA